VRNLFSDYVPEKRLTKRQGSSERENIRKTTIDIVKVCLDPSLQIQLPVLHN